MRWHCKLLASIIAFLALAVACTLIPGGCANLTPEQVNDAYVKTLALAEEGKVRGRIKLILNSDLQVGLIEAVTIRSPGSRLEVDLEANYDNGTE